MTTNNNRTVFTCRINEDLLDKVKADAKKNKRSAAGQIEFVLENYYLYLDNKNN